MNIVQRIKELLAIDEAFHRYIGGHIEQKGDEYWACCPLHQEKSPSFSLNPQKGVFKCFGCGKSGDVINLIAEFRGKSVQETISFLAQDLNISLQRQNSLKTTKREHIYRDEAGNQLFKRDIYYDNNGTKKAGWWHWSEGEWKKGLNHEKPPLYRLPELLQGIRQGGSPIYVCEGEKDVETLYSYGLVATTNGSASDFWTRDKIEIMPINHEVYVLSDNDDVGKKLALDTAEKLAAHGCKVKLVNLLGLPEHGDVTDWLAIKGHDIGQLKKYILEDVPYYGNVKESQPQKALNSTYEIANFSVENESLGYWQTVRENKIFIPISNFIPQPIREIKNDDGVETNFSFEIKGEIISTNVMLPSLTVKAEDFPSIPTWMVKGWGLRAFLYANSTAKEKMREYIQLQAQHIDRKTIYHHTGWRNVNGKRIYLHNAGAVGEHDIEVDLSGGQCENLKFYELPQECKDPHQAVEAALATLKVADHKLTIPLFASVFLGISMQLCEEAGISIDTTPFLVGTTQHGKSSLAALFLTYFGSGFNSRRFPASFRGSPYSVEKVLFIVKDALVVIDDFYPPQSAKERQELNKAAQFLARNRGDGANRTRLDSNMNFRKTFSSRGFALVTGEQIPDIGESGQARFLFLKVHKSMVDYYGNFKKAEKNKELLSEFTKIYIDWIAENWNELLSSLPSVFEKISQEFTINDSGVSGRIMNSGVQMLLGFWLGMAFIFEKGYITEDEFQNNIEHAKQVISEIVKDNLIDIVEEKPTEKFITALRELIATKKAIIYSLYDNSEPEGHIGFEDENFYYLIPGVTFNSVNDYYDRNFPINRPALFKQLFEAGIIKAEPQKRKRYTLQKHIPALKKKDDYIWLRKNIQ